MSDAQQAKRIELILRQLDQIPTLPTVVLRVLQATGDSDGSMSELAQIIESDLALTVSILHHVRRPDVAVRGEITTVERACVLLGLETVRAIVLAISVFDTLEGHPAAPRQTNKGADSVFSREEFWKHSIAVACAAELLAEKMVQDQGAKCGVTASEAFVCGLLHDLGKAALDAVLPKAYAKVVQAADLLRANIADLERSYIGLDHLIAGKRLAERWNLPAPVAESIWLHGQLPSSLPASVQHARMINLITLADRVAREQHIGYSGNHAMDFDRQPLLDALGLKAQAIDPILPKLLARIEERAGLLNLNIASTQELYQQAMKRANQELGRTSTQLALKTRRLETRAKFFDLLGQFHGGLRPDSTPDDCLAAIGRCAQAATVAKSIAVFSLAPGQDYGQAVVLNETGAAVHSTLVDYLELPQPAVGDGPVLPAGDEIDWLISAVGDRLHGPYAPPGDPRHFWICLRDDHRCIGGLLWSAAAGEGQRLSAQSQELTALASAWQLALRMAQVRQDSLKLAEQLAQANRELAAQQQDLQRTKLTAAIGEMAAGAAHEMNNPLAVIAGRSQLLAAQLADAKHQATARLIAEQSERLSQIITELMECARPTPAARASCEVADLISAAIRQAKTRADLADRSIETTMAEVPPIEVDCHQVASALFEILENALLATAPPAGEQRGPQSRVQIHAAYDPMSRNVALTVTDDGPGMDDATLRRAFDPFFSSQPAGRRRGLGLAKALKWVQASGGSLKLESRPGHGTRAVLLFPAAEPMHDPSVARAI